MTKRLIAMLLIVAMGICLVPITTLATQLEVPAPSAILMEAETGEILFESNGHEQLRPASVTKIMTLLLVMEAIEEGSLNWTDSISASAEAAGKGGSQVFLEEGEQMSVEEMVKSVCVSSANDCATALAEAISGSEAVFVGEMNQRAKELGMENTMFYNCTGLDDGEDGANHLSTAYDIALMSRELLTHDEIRKFTTIWMDTVRDGQFGLSNTNKLVRFYDGTTGLKTGYTSAAGHCLSATALRDGMELIAVVLNCANSTERFNSAKTMLEYGFANYVLISPEPQEIGEVSVTLGEKDKIVPILSENEAIVIDKAGKADITTTVELDQQVQAPVEKGQKMGTMIISTKDEVLKKIPLVCPERIEKKSWWQVATEILRAAFITVDPQPDGE